MKLFSRKAIAAVATTVALTTAGLSAPAFAEETVPAKDESSVSTVLGGSSDMRGSSDTLGSSDNPILDENGDPKLDENGDPLVEENSSKDPDDIKSWIGVFTAIVGALSTAFVFMQRLNA